MFLRSRKNRSGNFTVQIISKSGGRYKIIKTIGTGSTQLGIQRLWFIGKQEIEKFSVQSALFVSEQDVFVE